MRRHGARSGRVDRVACGARVTTAMVAVLLAVLGTVAVGPTTAGAQAANAAGTGSQACPRVDVLLLIDQSASLRNTDPGDLRVAAAEELLRSLSASAAAGSTPVEVTIAGFGTAAAEAGRASLPDGVETAVDIVRPFADREGDLNTDYVLALTFAVGHFAAITDLPSNCKRMVWFTDGAYSIDAPTAAGIATYTTSTDPGAIVAELGGQVCGPVPGSSLLTTPLSQQIRQTGFVVQLVDLRNDGAETPQEQADRAATTPVIDRLLGGNVDDQCTVAGGRVQANQADELFAEFFSQGQIALGRREVDCAAMDKGFASPLVRAVTVRGDSPQQPLVVASGTQTLAQGTGFVTWTRPADLALPGATTWAGSAGGAPPASCYVELAGSITSASPQRIEPSAASTTLSWAVVGAGAALDPSLPENRLGPEAVTVVATKDGQNTLVTWEPESRTWEVKVPGPVDEMPVVVVTASVDRYGQVAAASSALEEGALLTPPRVGWAGSARFEGPGTFDGRLRVTPGPVPAGSPIPDGVVCIEVGAITSSLPGVSAVAPEPRSCHPVNETFDVYVEVSIEGERNDTFDLVVPYTMTHQPVGTEAQLVVATGDADVPTLGLAKPADALKGAVLGFVIVLLSTMLPLAILILLINEQRRLPRPGTRVVARVPLVPDGGAVRRPPGSAVSAADVTPVLGTRRRYDLPGGFTLESPRTLNPFAATAVEARGDGGRITAVPWMAPGSGTEVQVPAGFTHLVLIQSEPGATEAVAVVVGPADADAAELDGAIDDAVRSTNRLWGRISSAMRLIDL